jgi:hypothetical protein
MKLSILPILCAAICCGSLPAFADTATTAVKHGLRHKLAKLTGDTILLPAECAASPVVSVMFAHGFLPWPPNSASKSDYGDSTRYDVLVPCLYALAPPVGTLVIGSVQLGTIAKDVHDVVTR